MTQVDNSVRAVLSGRAPICLTPEQTIRQAASILSNHEIGAAPVLAGDRLVGIFSERDILRRVAAIGGDLDMMRVVDAMTRDPRTVSIETSLVEALALMIEGNFRHLRAFSESASRRPTCANRFPNGQFSGGLQHRPSNRKRVAASFQGPARRCARSVGVFL